MQTPISLQVCVVVYFHVSMGLTLRPLLLLTTCYRDVIEQLPLVWFVFIGDIMYPQWSIVQEKTYFCKIVKGMEQNSVLA